MASRSPDAIPPAESRRRRTRALRLARAVGFTGRVEYRHVYSQAGGAQYGRGAVDGSDLLIVFAEAFERDANPKDFSLTAMIAHERGHQLVARHPRISGRMAGLSLPTEEVVASVLGALVLGPGPDANDLLAKALAEVMTAGNEPTVAERLVQDLCDTLGALL
jgi:hypothetical protein